MSMALPSGTRAPTHPAQLAPASRGGCMGRWLRRVLLGAVLWMAAYHGLPRMLELPPPLLKAPSPGAEITDRNGRPLRRLLADGQRIEHLTFDGIPRDLVEATVSAEDQRFWTHGGIDGIGSVRAALDSLFAGRRVSGASTITQQLVKVSLGRYSNRTWKDKLREMAYARKLEMTWSKEHILTEYLQRVNYGNQTTGCAAAAALYFKKPLGDLSLAESAFLAGLPQAPTRLNPYRNFEGAKKRQEWILARMREDGRLTAGEAARAAGEPLRLRRWTGGFEAPHFVEMLLAEKGQATPDTPATGPDSAADRATEATGHREADPAPGEPIRTTLDLELQQFCETAVRTRLAPLMSRRVRDAAVVVLDNDTGGLLALVGSPDFFNPRDGQVNGALAPRSAGSTLKPFTYLLALQQGDSPATIVADLPIEFMTPTGLYTPENYDRRHHGPISYREALANSLNIAAVRVLQRIGGPGPLHSTLHSLGLTTLRETPEHYGLGLTIGNAEVRLLDLANAYACLARLGIWRPVVLHLGSEPAPGDETTPSRSPAGTPPPARIAKPGHPAWASSPPPPAEAAETPRLDPDACWLIGDILSDAQARARCFGLDSPLRLAFPAAVKTGTSTDFRDNWCVGYTSEFTVAVWVGNFDHRPMDQVSGVTGAAPVWRDVMNWLEHRRGATWPAQPDTIAETDVDPLTGKPVPVEWTARRPAVREKCALTALPAAAPPERYDVLGRVILPREYTRWLRSPDNWLGAMDAVAGTGLLAERGHPLRITSPLAGTTLILDPDLPGGGQRLPLKASAPLAEAEWSSDSLAIEHDGQATFAHLIPGEHKIRLRNPQSGESAVAAITVRSL